MQRDNGCGSAFLVILAFSVYFTAVNYIGWWWASGIAVGLIAFFGLAFIVSKHQDRIQSEDASALANRLDNVGSLSGAQFEQLVADIFNAQGFAVTMLGGSGDQGVDLIANGTDGKAAIQCKNYAKAVGNAPVQEVYSGSKYHNCDEAWVIAPRGYTKGAHDLAQRVNVCLLDTASLREMIRQIDIAQKNQTA